MSELWTPPKIRTCFKCGIEFEDQGRIYCSPCTNVYEREVYRLHPERKERYRERKKRWRRSRNAESYQYVASLKTGPCTDCGVTYPPYVMDFDHLDKSTKLFNVGQGARSAYSKEAIDNEISKCELVCANCHRIRTHGE